MNPVRDKLVMFYTYVLKLEEGKARSRELYLKSGMGKRYLKNRLGASCL